MKGYKEIRKINEANFSESDWNQIQNYIEKIPPEVQILVFYNSKIILSTIPELKTGSTHNPKELFDFVQTTNSAYDYQFQSFFLEDQQKETRGGSHKNKGLIISRFDAKGKSSLKRIPKFMMHIFFVVLVFETLSITVIILIAKSVSNSIEIIQKATQKIANGELDTKLEISGRRNSNEILQLTEDLERMEKEGVTLAPDAEKESYNEQFYLYLALTKASEQVILTYSVMTSKGESKRPSYLINRVKQVFPKLVVEKEEMDTSYEKIMGSDKGKSYLISHLADGSYAKDVIWWEIASHYEKKTPGILKDLLRIREKRAGNNSLKKEAAKRLFGDVLYGSVTRFEQYVQCPFAFFSHYGLLLNERQQYEISSLDHGNLFHQAMEHLSHELEQRNKNWQDLSEEKRLRRLPCCRC
mgnify:CR=1 FL=1